MTRSCTHERAAFRKGVRISTLGRVNDWSRVSREVDEDDEASSAFFAKNSLFFKILERVLKFKPSQEFSDGYAVIGDRMHRRHSLGYVVHRVQSDRFAHRGVFFRSDAKGSIQYILVRSERPEPVRLDRR